MKLVFHMEADHGYCSDCRLHFQGEPRDHRIAFHHQHQYCEREVNSYNELANVSSISWVIAVWTSVR